MTSNETQTAVSRKEEALWLLERFAPGTGVNNLSVALEVDGRLDADTVRAALTAVVRHHEQLCTTFAATADGLVKTVLDADAVDVVVDEADRPAADVFEATLQAYVGEPFPIDARLLVRARVFHAEGRDLLCVVVHHLIFDTISVTPFLEDFIRAYETPGSLDAARRPVICDPEPSERSRRFWRTQLEDFAGVSADLLIGSDAGASTSLLGEVLTVPLDADVVAGARQLQQQLRASEAVVLLAAFYALLVRHGAGPDVVVGSPVTSRPPEAQDAIGYHINVVPMRAQVDLDAPFATLVKKTRATFMSSMTHADVSVDVLQGEVERTNRGWRNKLFRHVFNFVPDTDDAGVTVAGHDARLLGVENGYSKFDLEFFVLPGPDGIRLRVCYHRDAFDAAEVQLLVERYQALLRSGCLDPQRPVGQLAMFGATDAAILARANDTGAPPAPGVLAEIVRHARTSPQHCAVRQDGRDVGYGQLVAAAARNATNLVLAGVQPGSVVGVAVSRSAELAAAALGCWLAGAAYMPIDPAHPQSRIAYQFEDSGAGAVVAGADVELSVGDAVTVVEAEPADGPVLGDAALAVLHHPTPDALAYLIYTSGSTGRPKGTLLTHGNLDNLIAAFAADLAADATTTTLWSTTFSFDISALELFLPLATGAVLVVAGDTDRHDGTRLRALLTEHDVRVVQGTPTAWRLTIDEIEDVLDGRTVLCGGEPMPAELAARMVRAGADLRNVYGPTETCIWSTAGPVREADLGQVTVGVPLRNTQVFVRDARDADLPIGVPGELCIAGTGVCDGYHERPDLNETRFGVHPVHGRFYRTGDRARWLPDGRLQVLGRADRQIKLRGMRIELGEIETVLRAHDGVRNAGVVVTGDTTTVDGALIAFVEPAPDSALDPDALWRHAREDLPRALLPQEFVTTGALPTNSAHKIDYPELTRRAEALRAEQAAQRPADAAGSTEAGDGADDPLLATLIGLFAQTLGRPDVGADTNFFAYGGHSLLAVRLVQTIAETTQCELALPDLFSAPTPREVAVLVRARPAA